MAKTRPQSSEPFSRRGASVAVVLFLVKMVASGCGDASQTPMDPALESPAATFREVAAALEGDDWHRVYDLLAPSDRESGEAGWAARSEQLNRRILRRLADMGCRDVDLDKMTHEGFFTLVNRDLVDPARSLLLRAWHAKPVRVDTRGDRATVWYEGPGGRGWLEMVQESGNWYLRMADNG